ncbi:hypothetical protein FOHLNKBM_4458 [Methylobacterium longum]|nr:hypothetical protein FOHLNKBM_4458 [Methylobacterium longum]
MGGWSRVELKVRFRASSQVPFANHYRMLEGLLPGIPIC